MIYSPMKPHIWKDDDGCDAITVSPTESGMALQLNHRSLYAINQHLLQANELVRQQNKLVGQMKYLVTDLCRLVQKQASFVGSFQTKQKISASSTGISGLDRNIAKFSALANARAHLSQNFAETLLEKQEQCVRNMGDIIAEVNTTLAESEVSRQNEEEKPKRFRQAVSTDTLGLMGPLKAGSERGIAIAESVTSESEKFPIPLPIQETYCRPPAEQRSCVRTTRVAETLQVYNEVCGEGQELHAESERGRMIVRNITAKAATLSATLPIQESYCLSSVKECACVRTTRVAETLRGYDELCAESQVLNLESEQRMIAENITAKAVTIAIRLPIQESSFLPPVQECSGLKTASVAETLQGYDDVCDKVRDKSLEVRDQQPPMVREVVVSSATSLISELDSLFQ